MDVEIKTLNKERTKELSQQLEDTLSNPEQIIPCLLMAKVEPSISNLIGHILLDRGIVEPRFECTKHNLGAYYRHQVYYW